ncbi:MAG: OadG family protein [Lachnospiraceae bacterium]|nr:OadG family protein [Lachnospiraceae bacterium]
MNMVTIMQALDIMWKGMLGIFVALVVIMIFVWIMAKIGAKKNNDAKESENK